MIDNQNEPLNIPLIECQFDKILIDSLKWKLLKTLMEMLLMLPNRNKLRKLMLEQYKLHTKVESKSLEKEEEELKEIYDERKEEEEEEDSDEEKINSPKGKFEEDKSFEEEPNNLHVICKNS